MLVRESYTELMRDPRTGEILLDRENQPITFSGTRMVEIVDVLSEEQADALQAQAQAREEASAGLQAIDARRSRVLADALLYGLDEVRDGATPRERLAALEAEAEGLRARAGDST